MHAGREPSNEHLSVSACGFRAARRLGWRHDWAPLSPTATAHHPVRNADASPYVYGVHPDDLVRIVLGIDDAGQDLVAIFHSHTHTPAAPSVTDLRSALYPDAFYLLASLTDRNAGPAESLRV